MERAARVTVAFGTFGEYHATTPSICFIRLHASIYALM